jgi:hypothetical protein
MRLLVAIGTLLCALFLLGSAYAGYVENGLINAAHAGSRVDKFYSPRTDGSPIEQAEEQGRLTIAGLEGIVGAVLLFTAVFLCGPADAHHTTSEYNLRGRGAPAGVSQSNSNDSLSRSARRRVEEVRQAHLKRTSQAKASKVA